MTQVKWATLDNENGDATLKQHAYISHVRNRYGIEYLGNKQLCAKGGVHDGSVYVKIEEIEGENLKEDRCKKCVKIVEKLDL